MAPDSPWEGEQKASADILLSSAARFRSAFWYSGVPFGTHLGWFIALELSAWSHDSCIHLQLLRHTNIWCRIRQCL